MSHFVTNTTKFILLFFTALIAEACCAEVGSSNEFGADCRLLEQSNSYYDSLSAEQIKKDQFLPIEFSLLAESLSEANELCGIITEKTARNRWFLVQYYDYENSIFNNFMFIQEDNSNWVLVRRDGRIKKVSDRKNVKSSLSMLGDFFNSATSLDTVQVENTEIHLTTYYFTYASGENVSRKITEGDFSDNAQSHASNLLVVLNSILDYEIDTRSSPLQHPQHQ